MMVVTVMPRVAAWSRMVSICWRLPSTRATQVRSWLGSRRSASSNMRVMTAGMSSVTLAASHLPVTTGPGRRACLPTRDVLLAGMMSSTVRGSGSRSYTATNSAIRLRPCFSPGDSRVDSFAEAFAANLAVLVAVYDLDPEPRTSRVGKQARRPGPVVTGKWLAASVTDDIPAVITRMFDEAERRDPNRERTWVALVDGNRQQIDTLRDQIATRISEGAARFLIKDRMDITGARWTTPGAEAVLHLRAVIANGDFDEYWQWHQQQELRRNHLDHYQQLDLAA